MSQFAVDIFFIISGFLITGILLYEDVPVKTFLLKRALRILPLYIFIIILVYISNHFVPPYSMKTMRIGLDPPQTLTLDKIVEEGKRWLLHNDKGDRVTAEIREIRNERAVIFLYEDGRQRGAPIDTDIGKNILAQKMGAKFKAEFGPVLVEEIWNSRNPKEASFLRLIFFTYNLVPSAEMTPQLIHLWFVSAVVQFYLFYALLVFVVGRFISDPGKKRRFLLFLLLLSVLLISAYKYNYKIGMMVTQTHARMDTLLIGCILKLAERRFMEKKGHFWDYVFPGALFALGCITILYIAYNWHKVMSNLFLFALSYLALGAMILGTLRRNKTFGAVFENRVIRWIGKYSFGIYLWHYPFLWLFVITRNYIYSTVFSIAIYVFFSIVIGALMEKLFNKAAVAASPDMSKYSNPTV